MKLITAPTVEYSAELTMEEFQVLGLLGQMVCRGSDRAGTSPGLSDSSALKAPNSSSHGLLHLEHLLFPILKLPKFCKVLTQDQFQKPSESTPYPFLDRLEHPLLTSQGAGWLV